MSDPGPPAAESSLDPEQRRAAAAAVGAVLVLAGHRLMCVAATRAKPLRLRPELKAVAGMRKGWAMSRRTRG